MYGHAGGCPVRAPLLLLRQKRKKEEEESLVEISCSVTVLRYYVVQRKKTDAINGQDIQTAAC
jgi:hypothetical protein